jgi:fatty acid synthase subunit alpha
MMANAGRGTVEPIWADLNAGIDHLPDLADITTKSWLEINAESTLCKAVSRDFCASEKKKNN